MQSSTIQEAIHAALTHWEFTVQQYFPPEVAEIAAHPAALILLLSTAVLLIVLVLAQLMNLDQELPTTKQEEEAAPLAIPEAAPAETAPEVHTQVVNPDKEQDNETTGGDAETATDTDTTEEAEQETAVSTEVDIIVTPKRGRKPKTKTTTNSSSQEDDKENQAKAPKEAAMTPTKARPLRRLKSPSRYSPGGPNGRMVDTEAVLGHRKRSSKEDQSQASPKTTPRKLLDSPSDSPRKTPRMNNELRRLLS